MSTHISNKSERNDVPDPTLEQLQGTIGGTGSREKKAKRIAEVIRKSGDYRWAGLYDVDNTQGKVVI
jgi:hypothetical protein